MAGRANGTMPEHVSDYGLLAPAEPAGDPAAAEIQECRDIHEATRRTGDQDTMETETGDRNGRRALIVCGIPEDADKERRPPERQRTLNTCGHQGGEGGGGGPLTQKHMPTVHGQGLEGESQTRQRALLACGQGTEEEGGTPTQKRAQPARG